MNKKSIGAFCAVLILCTESAAQAADESAKPAQASAKESSSDKDSSSWAVDTVVVTGKHDGYVLPEGGSATRTNTPLINVPQSVQVLNKSLITDQDRRTLADALVNVSGVVPTKPEESAIAQPLVRGFPAEIYLDGLPAFGINALADPTSLTGVERIEVVKGPTSTVYGGGAGAPLGGLIDVVSVRPEANKTGGYVAFRSGSFSTLNPYADLNVPVGDRVAARITGEYQRNKSWIDQVEGERWSIQPSVSFQVDDQTELLVRGKYDRRVQLEYSGLPAAAALAGQIDRNAFPGAPIGQPRSTIINKLVTAELRHKFNEDVQLTVTGRYYQNRYDEYGSFAWPDFLPPDPATPTVYPIFPIYLPARVKEATTDANLLANVDALGGRHELMVGANYDHTNYETAMNFDFVPVGVLDLAHPTYTLSFGPTPPVLITQTDVYQTVAGYVQDQATYGRLHLSGSLRYTRFNFRRREAETDATYNRVTPRLGATFDVVPGAALFAGFATGFRGALQFTAQPGQTVKPETSRSFEGGLKLALTEAHVWGTVAAFELKRRNVPTPDPDNSLLSIQTGEQRARGMEADLTWEPIRALSILANYAFTEAEVTKDTIIPVGDKLPRVPKHSGRIAAHYRVLTGPAEGLSFGAGITAFSDREVILPNSVSVPGYTVLDAQASYDFDRYTITVSAVNLAGRRGFDTYEYLSPVVIPTQPRSAYVMLKARF